MSDNSSHVINVQSLDTRYKASRVSKRLTNKYEACLVYSSLDLRYTGNTSYMLV